MKKIICLLIIGVLFTITGCAGTQNSYPFELIQVTKTYDSSGQLCIRAEYKFTNDQQYIVSFNDVYFVCCEDNEAHLIRGKNNNDKLMYQEYTKIKQGESINIAFYFVMPETKSSADLHVTRLSDEKLLQTICCNINELEDYAVDDVLGLSNMFLQQTQYKETDEVLKPLTFDTPVVTGKNKDLDFELLQADVVLDLHGNAALKTQISVTNNTDKNIDLSENLVSVAYQQGYSLPVTFSPIKEKADMTSTVTEYISEYVEAGRTIVKDIYYFLPNDNADIKLSVTNSIGKSNIQYDYTINL